MKHLLPLFCISLLFGACQNATTTESKPEKKQDQTEAAAPKPPKEEKKPVEPIITTGIDVSHFNGTVNWDEVDAEKYAFAYAKATEGEAFVDPDFVKNWEGIKQSGMKRGAYHFYVAQDNGKTQAQHFLSVVKDWDESTDLAPVIDLEGSSIGGMTVEDYQNNVLSWLNTVEEKLGVAPVIYTDNPFATQFLNNEAFAKYKLWIAQYTDAKEPEVPALWKEKGWYMWQHESKGDVKGVEGSVDEDYMKS
jgi:lysozyme